MKNKFKIDNYYILNYPQIAINKGVYKCIKALKYSNSSTTYNFTKVTNNGSHYILPSEWVETGTYKEIPYNKKVTKILFGKS